MTAIRIVIIINNTLKELFLKFFIFPSFSKHFLKLFFYFYINTTILNSILSTKIEKFLKKYISFIKAIKIGNNIGEYTY
jgi:hypothetical protein